MTAKISQIMLCIACVILCYGLYIMFSPSKHLDKDFLAILMSGFLVASIAMLLDTYSWSAYSRERRDQRRAQLIMNYICVIGTAASLVWLIFSNHPLN
jgi:hypothetical protein